MSVGRRCWVGSRSSARAARASAGHPRDVCERGDAALLDYAERFDSRRRGCVCQRKRFVRRSRRPTRPISRRYGRRRRTSRHSTGTVHRRNRRLTGAGVRVWRVWRPIERIGIYTPGGGALYPSCLLMAAIPARVAGAARSSCARRQDRMGMCRPGARGRRIAGVTESTRSAASRPLPRWHMDREDPTGRQNLRTGQ